MIHALLCGSVVGRLNGRQLRKHVREAQERAVQLTYADRELFVETFHCLSKEWQGADESLLQRTTAWAERLQPQFGFEDALTRDVVALGRYVTTAPPEIASLARGGLSYILHAVERDPTNLKAFGLLDEAFIAGFALNEIRNRIGEPAPYLLPQLSADERKKAESIFLSFFGHYDVQDEQLIAESRLAIQGLGEAGRSGIFRRLRDNAETLSNIVSDTARTSEHRDCARAALNYLVCRNDALGDDLGLVGYLDDAFIVQMAVELIEGSSEPWLELLDAATGVWPFVNALHMGTNGIVRPLSEFMIVNSALACPEIRGDNRGGRTDLIVPYVGPIPFLIGLVRAFGLVHEAARQSTSANSFRPGQKVHVDYESVRIFAGVRTVNGREEFGLEQRRKEKGQTLRSITWWPITELHRLTPAQFARTTRGKITFDKARDSNLIHPLEQLFLDASVLNRMGQRQIVIATEVGRAQELAASIKLNDQPLHDTLPMGHLSSSGELVRWSTRFGTLQPVVLCAPDLDYACELIEGSPESTRLVIIDGESRNAGRSASLARIESFGVSTLFVAADRTMEIAPDRGGAAGALWEWSSDDLRSLRWPRRIDRDTDVVGNFEQQVQRAIAAEVSVHEVTFPEIREALNAIKSLQSVAAQRDGDRLLELDDAVNNLFFELLRVIRCPIPTNQWPGLIEGARKAIRGLETVARTSSFVSAEEKAAAEATCRQVDEMLASICVDNRKATALANILRAHPKAVVLLGARGAAEMVARTGSCQHHPVVHFEEFISRKDQRSAAVVPGWYGRKQMSRLLLPPAAPSVDLVLYDVEAEWCRGFRQRVANSAARRGKQADRSRLFPKVGGWRKQEQVVTTGVEDRAETLLETAQQQIWDTRRRNLLRVSASDGTESDVLARLVLFESGEHAFLTDRYRAKIATHLLNSAAEADSGAQIEIVPARELKVGDALLFRRGADSDVIRMVADKLLPAGIREQSALWKRSLRGYMQANSMSADEVWQQLRQGGCPIGPQAVGNWIEDDDLIAPLAYERDVAIIAAVTGDSELRKQQEACIKAIATVRSAHMRASHQIAAHVVGRAVDALRRGESGFSRLDIIDDIVLLRIAEIDDTAVRVRASISNRLQEPTE